MKNSIVVCLFLCFTGVFGSDVDLVWGKTGHRVVGEVAQKHLSRKAKRQILKILNGESLANASTFADDIKSDRAFKEFSSWHYVNMPLDKHYHEVTPSTRGDLVNGIAKCVTILKSENASAKDRTFYLKMLIHFIGDLHQPLHIGRAEDKGGNDIQVRWFNDGTNLHKVWDSKMIDNFGMSYSELSINLPILGKEQQKAIQQGTVLDWIHETQDLTKKVYASAEVGEKLRYRYMYDHFGTVKQQLQKGGLRLAKLLNDIFG